jgi:hypothetical protein
MTVAPPPSRATNSSCSSFFLDTGLLATFAVRSCGVANLSLGLIFFHLFFVELNLATIAFVQLVG